MPKTSGLPAEEACDHSRRGVEAREGLATSSGASFVSVHRVPTGPDAPPESRLEEIRERRARIVGLMAAATGRSEAEVEDDLAEHRSFDADEAVAYGLVDRIVRSRDDLA